MKNLVENLMEFISKFENIEREFEALKKNTKENIVSDRAWLTDQEMMERFSIKSTTLRQWRLDYQLPFIQVDSIRRYNPIEVDQWFCDFRTSKGLDIINKHLGRVSQKAA